jgi:hypothetical protein
MEIAGMTFSIAKVILSAGFNGGSAFLGSRFYPQPLIT